MSNPDPRPDEVRCASETATGVEVMPWREVPLGGPRAMTVRRTLPQRRRSLIGAWCFVDHYGPDDVAGTAGMQVPGHPHTGLQTVSWLFTGEVEHRDTTGVHALVRPGELNLMTAGSGIAHSEFSTPETTVLHGAQLWVALPAGRRDTAPRFEHYTPPTVDIDGASMLVFLGTLAGQTSPVGMHSPIVGAEFTVAAGRSLTLTVDATFEHGILVDTGVLTVDAVEVKRGELCYTPTGLSSLDLVAGPDEAARVLLLGGVPFGEQIIMWWNFIGRSHEEVVAFRDDWQRERSDQGPSHLGAAWSRRFGSFPDAWAETLPAPMLPNLRLRSRG